MQGKENGCYERDFYDKWLQIGLPVGSDRTALVSSMNSHILSGAKIAPSSEHEANDPFA